MRRRHPIVFVGAGPGDPELITIKGQKALASADRVLYAGSLVSKALLGWVRPGVELVDTAPLWLEAILERMIQGYRAGKRVVRVHSGDLSLFSAIHEQIDVLEREGIPFTLIPGVTAASAASAVLARELTLPEVTQTVILTRAAGRTPVPERETLAKLAQHRSSMAIYLSVQQIDEVAKALASAYGLDARAVVAYRVSWPEQELITGTLATIAGKVREAGIKRQALILVGPAMASRGSRTQTRSRLYDETFSHGWRGQSRRGGIRVMALTTTGASLARDICRKLDGAECWLPSRLAADAPDARGFDRLSQSVEEAFRLHQDLICIMAVGVVVRAIASQLKGKSKDPAVVVVDERGQSVVSLLSGHLGGANELARRVAALTGGKAVITTATDLHGLPAFDLLAKKEGLVIENLPAVRDVHMALLEGRTVRLVDPDGRLGGAALCYPDVCIQAAALEEALTLSGPAVYVGCLEREWPKGWLLLRPRDLVAGVGCNRGTGVEEIVGLIRDAFAQEGLSLHSLRSLATIEAKRDEPGLQEAARQLGVALTWFSAEALKEIPVPHPSEIVARHMGVVSVCEASAMLAAETDQLIVPKRKTDNVTLAVAKAKWPS